MRVKHLPQAISTCVTSLFMEHNLRPEMQPIVPTILIDGDTFRVTLYDCLKDVLLISQPKDHVHSTMSCLYNTIAHSNQGYSEPLCDF